MKLTAARVGEPAMHFHQLSFEGPDAYARAGGLASRVVGLGRQLAALGHETHLWFVGDPTLPDHDCVGRERLLARPSEERALRRRGLATARRFAWSSVITHNLVPQIELCGA